MRAEPDTPAPKGAPRDGRVPVPLVVGLTAGLLQSDLYWETLWRSLGANLGATLVALTTAPRGDRQDALGAVAALDPHLLPLRPETVARIDKATGQGRPVILLSDRDAAFSAAIAARLAGSVEVASAARRDWPGILAARFGPQGFELIAGPEADPALTRLARPMPPATPRDGWKWADLRRALRPHQWVKNLLLLLPVIAAQQMSAATLVPVLVAILAFCAGASAIYLLNDLLDLANDRVHPEKRHRPLAAGRLPIPVAMRVSAALALVALLGAAALGGAVAGLLLAYMALSLVYSLRLKAIRWVDQAVLASLFTLRVVTGAVAAGVALPPALAGFVFAVFYTLAGVKRLTALARLRDHAHLPGRGYGHGHSRALRNLAVLGTAVAVATLLLHGRSPAVHAVFSQPVFLQAAALPVAIWLLRMIRLGLKGQEDFDPVVFVLHDRAGLVIAAAGVALFLLAL